MNLRLAFAPIVPATLVLATTLGCAPPRGGAQSDAKGAHAATGPAYYAPVRDDDAAKASPTVRLSDDVVPRGYALALAVDPLETFVEGVMTITADVTRATPILWLNAEGMTFARIGVTAANAAGVVPGRLVAGKPGFVGVTFAAPLPVGPIEITLVYRASVSITDDHGLFRKWEDQTAYAYTNFEPEYARRAFPCFDDPRFKVPWSLTLDVPDAASAFANTPPTATPRTSARRPEFKRITFATTKPLPSYLVAFAVGPFDVRATGASRGGAPLRIITPKGAGKKADFVAAHLAPIVTNLESYFDIPYPYEKLDIVAIPDVSYAMENAGLITMGTAMLYADERDGDRATTYDTLAHELAHHWFGDLVTMASWDDVWLNESFASWMAAKELAASPAEARGSWDVGLGAVSSASWGMAVDASPTARRIREPIRERADVNAAFDAITYQKGAAVLRMFEVAVGEDVFRRAVRAHLRGHAYGSATTADFLRALDDAAGREVSAELRPYLDERGVPLLSMDLDCQRPRARLRVRATGSSRWTVPLCVRFGGGADEHADDQACTTVAPRAETPTVLALPFCPTWLVPNAHGIAYAHVRTSGAARAAMLASTPHAQPGELLAMALTSFAAALDGADDDIATTLDLLRRPPPAADLYLLSREASIVDEMATLGLFPPSRAPAVAAYVRDVFGPLAHRFGLTPKEDDDAIAKSMRAKVVLLVANLGDDPALVEEARAMTTKDLAAASTTGLSEIWWARVITAAHGDGATFEAFRRAYALAKSDGARHALLYEMGAFRDPPSRAAAFDFALTSAVSTADLWTPFVAATSSAEGARAASAFAREHATSLLEKSLKREGATLFDIAASSCVDESHDAFVARYEPRVAQLDDGAARLRSAVEKLDRCVRARAAQATNVARYFASPRAE